MPSFVQFKRKPGLRQDGINLDQGFPIRDFTKEEAHEFAELIKQEFIKHWEKQQSKK